jgi:flavin reductase (DIM6/NTAB) family NADH-FMN oxidoreductase RutF
VTTDPVDPAPGVDPLDYRRVVGRFTTGVTVVTAAYDGVDYAMTVSSFASVSLDPLLLLFCCEKTSRLHRAILGGADWAVSVLSADQRDVAQWFATRGRPLDGQFRRVPHRRAATSGAVILTDAIATIECRTTGTHDAGDHTVVIGEVLAVDTPRPDGQPLLYFRGKYSEFGSPSGA